jgi:hypothetical protein
MASDPGGQDRVIGVWGARAYALERRGGPRAAGFSIDVSGRTRAGGGPSSRMPAGERARVLSGRVPLGGACP